MVRSIIGEIAAVTFSVSCPDAAIVPVDDPGYASFMRSSRRLSGLDIEIRVEHEGVPQGPNGSRIFDSGESWSLYRGGDVLSMVLEPPAFAGRPIWRACFRRPVESVTVYCSDMLVRRKEGRPGIENPVRYPLDQMLLMYALSGRGGAIVHAAGMDVGGRCYVFPGRSGAGKSTLTRLFIGRDNIGMLSDDRIIVRKMNDAFHAFGTPWPGDAGIAENKSFPLAGIFFIQHASSNRITPIAPRQAVERLMPVTSIPWYDEEVMSDILSFCEDLVLNVPAYDLHFKPDTGVVKLLEEFLY